MNKTNILITGASSGIGRALAIEYASPETKLFLLARSESKLIEVEKLCKKLGAEVEIIILDVTNNEQMSLTIEKISFIEPLDIIIASAGISAGTSKQIGQHLQTLEIMQTNLNGVLNTILPAIPFMVQKQKGNIVIISSMASLIALASSPAYSASKAAIKIFGDSLRVGLKDKGINVCMVIPGYVKSPMTEVNGFIMPFIISAEKAAKLIKKGVNKKQGLITFPWIVYISLKIINLLPYKLIDLINSKLPGKKPLF